MIKTFGFYNAHVFNIGCLFVSIFSLYLYRRKKLRTCLVFSIVLFLYSLASVFLIPNTYGYGLISFVIAALIALGFSMKELTQADKTGKSAVELFHFDLYDIVVASLLYALWSALKFMVLHD